MHIFNAIYDLRVMPPTFDLIGFLVVAYSHAKKTGASKPLINLVFVTNIKSFRDDFADSVDQKVEEVNRLDRILIPQARLLPFIVNIEIVNSNINKKPPECMSLYPTIFPVKYSYSKPELFKYYKPFMLVREASFLDLRMLYISPDEMEYARSILRQRCGSESPIIISERKNYMSKDSSRESDKQWLMDAYWMAKMFNSVIMIPDFKSTTVFPEDIKILHEAGFDLRLRTAIYACAELSILPPAGHSMLAFLNKDSRYIYYGQGDSAMLSTEYQLRHGFQPNVNPFSNDNYQAWIWNRPSINQLRSYLEKLYQSFSGKSSQL